MKKKCSMNQNKNWSFMLKIVASNNKFYDLHKCKNQLLKEIIPK